MTTGPIPLVIVLALLGLLPFAFMSLTAFVKISTVLHIVRGAIGAQSVPSTTVLMALAASLALIVMAPVGEEIYAQAEPVWTAEKPTTTDLVKGTATAVDAPLRKFWKANTSPRERQRFLALAREGRPPADRAKVQEDSWIVLLPAFLISELTEAFALGFAIYLPFLVVDLVVANVLLALGMQMMSPTQVSLPFKLLLFVALDGWGLLAQSLIGSY